ncbi:MAG: glycoside hydrolase family 3 C-terminal domain-containing protein [Clostridia bacterium]|nr:glycoside hydrolase family 3 C-terminal domain-containing protein [Clostridia bacterium]
MQNYKDPALSPAERAEDLLSRMTLREKIAQTDITRGVSYSLEGAKNPGNCCVEDGDTLDMDKFAALVGDRGVGYIHDIYSSPCYKNELQRYLVEKTRLGIPCIFTAEALHGVMHNGASILPVPLVLSQSFDPYLAEEYGDCIASETRVLGHHEILAPNLDVAREPRWGRTEETLGEDVCLSKTMGIALIRGEQKGDISRPDAIITEPKHYVVHGIAEGGLNCAPARAGVREVETEYLPVFEAAIREGGAYNVMACYNSIDSEVVISSRRYMTEILKERIGLPGISRADWGAIERLLTHHRTAGNRKDAVRAVKQAGLDMQGCCDVPEAEYEQILLELYESGELSIAELDESVRRILKMKFELGLFEHPYADDDAYKAVLRCEKHRVISLRTAQEGVVLLQNDGVLPLKKDTASIAVIGPSSMAQKIGGYSSRPTGYTIRSVYEEMREKFPASAVRQCDGCAITHTKSGDDIQYVDGQPHLTKKLDADIADMIDQAAGIAASCDVAVLVCGDNTVTSGEGMDRCSLTLAGKQRELIRKVAATGTPVVLVLENGKAVDLSEETALCGAILIAGFGGEFGARAIVDVLAGDVNPAGRLSVSFPRKDGMVPCYYTRRPGGWPDYYEGASSPLFAFGFGLSYTKFAYSDLRIDRRVDCTFDVSFTLKNVGDRDGDEVAQLYLNDVVSSVATPLRQLRAFRRVHLRKGEQIRLTFTLTWDDFKLYNAACEWVVEPGDFEVFVGAASSDVRLSQTITI